MSATIVPSMIIADVELRARPGLLTFSREPLGCDHAWEPHLWEIGHAYCPCCGSRASWVNDPRVMEET